MCFSTNISQPSHHHRAAYIHPKSENDLCAVTRIVIPLFLELCFAHPGFSTRSQVSNISISFCRKEQQRQKRNNHLKNLDMKVQFSITRRRRKEISMWNEVQYKSKRKTLFAKKNAVVPVLFLRNFNIWGTFQNYFITNP